MDKVKKWISENVVIVVLILLCIGFGVGNPTFITPQNIINVLSQMCINALLASGLVYVIILGGIDISVGSVVGLSGVCAALVGLKFFPNMGIPTALAVLILTGLVMGAIIGGFNGLMIAKFKVVPMIATLAMLSIARGLAYIVSGGQPVYGLPNSFASTLEWYQCTKSDFDLSYALRYHGSYGRCADGFKIAEWSAGRR